MSFLLERVWFAARLGPWWICWETFQVLAIVAGAALLARRSRERAHRWAYVAGIVAAVPGAFALGCGGVFVRWLAAGAIGPHPDVELAGTGALIAFLAAFALACCRSGSALVPAFDAVAPSIAVVLFFSRIGCFIGGCDFGRPSTLPWAMRFPVGTAAFRAQLDAGFIRTGQLLSLPVHPTQLYEAAAGLLLLCVLLGRPSRRTGGDIAFAVLGYAAARLLIDLARGDLARGSLGLTSTQEMALAVLAFGLGAHLRGRIRGVVRTVLKVE
ncbi:MAG: prolipoprotein diacylglyceryl transferase family protein [Polyangiaceae bacterium]